jgi:hypothetical protein
MSSVKNIRKQTGPSSSLPFDRPGSEELTSPTMPSPTDREKHNKEGGWNGGLSQTTERFESNLTAVDPVTGEIKKSVHLRYMTRQGDADAVRRHIGPDARSDDTELITAHIRRIEVRRTEIAVTLLSQDDASSDDTWRRIGAVRSVPLARFPLGVIPHRL